MPSRGPVRAVGTGRCHRVAPGSQTSPPPTPATVGGRPPRAWKPGAPVSAQHEQYLVGLDLSGAAVVVVGAARSRSAASPG